jgi:uncharacterized protein with von Willebrand factor type A (vWA) domain
MTAEEADRIERLTEQVRGYHEEVIKLSGRLDAAIETTATEFRGFKAVCNERHGIRPAGTLERLQDLERQHYGSWQKLVGIGAAGGACFATIVGLIIWALGG